MPNIVLLQETKMELISQGTIRNALGLDYQDNFIYLPAFGSSGGIIIAANPLVMQIISDSSTSHTFSARVHDLRNNKTWTLTGVYGPQGNLERKMFIRELKQLSQSALPQWLIMGDFNLLYQESDKNSETIDRNMIHRFRRALNHMEVKEIQLSGRKFMWSNRHSNPTMSKIDHAFASVRWERWYAKPYLQTMSSSTSYHCPLMLSPLCPPNVRPRFKFESF
jgi:exonuclease III